MAIDDASGSAPVGGAGGGPSSTHDLEEIRRIREARQGDLDAFEWIYRRYEGRIFGLCMKMTGDRSRAEELTQDAFVRAWQKLHLFEPKWSFSSWFFKVAVNVVLTERRKQRRAARWLSPEDEAPPVGGTELQERHETGMDLERAMDRLPPRARMVFVLHDVEGHTHHDIAGMAGIAVGTSKAQLHRARRILREALRS